MFLPVPEERVAFRPEVLVLFRGLLVGPHLPLRLRLRVQLQLELLLDDLGFVVLEVLGVVLNQLQILQRPELAPFPPPLLVAPRSLGGEAVPFDHGFPVDHVLHQRALVCLVPLSIAQVALSQNRVLLEYLLVLHLCE